MWIRWRSVLQPLMVSRDIILVYVLYAILQGKNLNIHKGYGIHIVCSIHTVLIIKCNGSIIMKYTSLFVKYFYQRNVRLVAERMYIIIILHVILIDIWRFSVEIAVIYIPPCFYMCVYSGDISGCCMFQVPPRGYTVH